MASNRLQGHRVAVLATDGFEQVELEKPVEALRAEGAEVEVVAPKAGEIQGFIHLDKGRRVHVDRDLAHAASLLVVDLGLNWRELTTRRA